VLPHTNYAPSKQEIKNRITRAAKTSPVSGRVLLTIGKCESGFSQTKVGNAGEIGVFQFLPATWREFEQRSGKFNLNIDSVSDQIEMTIWAFEHGFQNRWTCFRDIY